MTLQPPEKQQENGGSLSRPALLMPSGQGHHLYKNGVSVVSQVLCRSLEIAENKQPGHSLLLRQRKKAASALGHKRALLQAGGKPVTASQRKLPLSGTMDSRKKKKVILISENGMLEEERVED